MGIMDGSSNVCSSARRAGIQARQVGRFVDQVVGRADAILDVGNAAQPCRILLAKRQRREEQRQRVQRLAQVWLAAARNSARAWLAVSSAAFWRRSFRA